MKLTDGAAEEVYENKVMKNHHGGVILVGDHLYGYSDGLGWVCQNFETGEQVWAEKKALGKGAIACADGMLYCVDEGSGEVVLIEASPKGWNEKAGSNWILSQSTVAHVEKSGPTNDCQWQVVFARPRNRLLFRHQKVASRSDAWHSCNSTLATKNARSFASRTLVRSVVTGLLLSLVCC